MISGGDGGLSIGIVHMDQYKLLNENNPIKDKNLAEEFVELLRNMTQTVYFNEVVEYQISGTNENGFYIWYKIIRKTCPIMK